jgi:hypothetical protein
MNMLSYDATRSQGYYDRALERVRAIREWNRLRSPNASVFDQLQPQQRVPAGTAGTRRQGACARRRARLA